LRLKLIVVILLAVLLICGFPFFYHFQQKLPAVSMLNGNCKISVEFAEKEPLAVFHEGKRISGVKVTVTVSSGFDSDRRILIYLYDDTKGEMLKSWNVLVSPNQQKVLEYLDTEASIDSRYPEGTFTVVYKVTAEDDLTGIKDEAKVSVNLEKKIIEPSYPIKISHSSGAYIEILDMELGTFSSNVRGECWVLCIDYNVYNPPGGFWTIAWVYRTGINYAATVMEQKIDTGGSVVRKTKGYIWWEKPLAVEFQYNFEKVGETILPPKTGDNVVSFSISNLRREYYTYFTLTYNINDNRFKKYSIPYAVPLHARVGNSYLVVQPECGFYTCPLYPDTSKEYWVSTQSTIEELMLGIKVFDRPQPEEIYAWYNLQV